MNIVYLEVFECNTTSDWLNDDGWFYLPCILFPFENNNNNNDNDNNNNNNDINNFIYES